MSDEIISPSRPKVIWFFWTVAGFALFALIGVYSAHMARTYPGYDDKRIAERYTILAKQRQDDQAALTTVDWVDKDKKIVRIPVDEAMAREIETLKATPVCMGALIPGAVPPPPPLPAPAPAAALSATPTTNAAPSTPTPPPAQAAKP